MPEAPFRLDVQLDKVTGSVKHPGELSSGGYLLVILGVVEGLAEPQSIGQTRSLFVLLAHLLQAGNFLPVNQVP
jgi:hypothetical protein